MKEQRDKINQLEQKVDEFKLKESVAIQQKKLEGNRSIIG